MRTLFVTMMAYPPIGGEQLRNWQNINMLSGFGPVAVFSIFNRANHYTGTADRKIALWQHYDITRSSSPKIKLELGRQWLQQYGLTYYAPYVREAALELDQLIKAFRPDLVVFEQIWLHPYLKVVRRHACRIIFDNHNVEAPLYRDTKAAGSGLRAWGRKKLHVPQIRSKERELIHTAEQVWVCSPYDEQIIQRLYGPIFHSRVIPNGVNITDYAGIRRQQYEVPAELTPTKHNVLFLGSFLYIPNIEAAQLLIEQIYPGVKQNFPDARLLLVGRGATPFMLEAARKDLDIIVTGEIPDIKPYLAAAGVMVVPLLQGSGTRFKILEAFAAGCPVVSTTKGAEGLQVEDGKHLLIADDPDAMVRGIGQIWSDESMGRLLAGSAYELVRSEYSWEAVAGCVAGALERLDGLMA